MKISIMGAPVSSGNRGVLALGASLINLTAEAARDAEIVLLLNNRDKAPARFRVNGRFQDIPVVNSRLSPKSKLRDHMAWILLMSLVYRLSPSKGLRARIARSTPWINTVAQSTFNGSVHGGDSFSDIYGLKGLMLTFAMDWSVILVAGSLVQFPQTFGPFKSRTSRLIGRFLLKRSSVIIARDKSSQAIAQAMVGRRNTVQLSPDVAFSLESLKPHELVLDPPLRGPVPQGVLGLNVNGLMYNGGYTKKNMFGLKMDYPSFLPALVTALMREHKGELWLVPHTFAPDGDVESDPEASRLLLNALPREIRDRIRIVAREYDQYEIKGVIGMCDFFVGSRMHACIAALSQGIPCVGVAYSMKFGGVFESVGMESWVVDGRSVGNEEAVTRILELYRQRNAVRENLKEHAEAARRRLRDVFAALIARAAASPDKR
jgi:polysaccharide pyruvyl transferase WcaK-like protein